MMGKLKLLGLMMAAILLLTGCGKNAEQNRIMEEVDGMVYSFIVGKVEGNDDLLAQLLTDKAEGIIKPGRHEFPGAAEEMGERYSITRYDNAYADGALFYEVTFYRPYTDKMDHYNVLVINTEEDGWLIAKNSSQDQFLMEQWIAEAEGVVIHEYKDGE